MTTDREDPIDRIEAKAQVALWIEEERNTYATPKWEEEHDKLQEENVRSGEWINFPFSYLQRCRMGLDQPAARQALGKVITSCTSLLERAVEIYGDMPKPGVSSTEGALPWDRNPEPDVSGLLPMPTLKALADVPAAERHLWTPIGIDPITSRIIATPITPVDLSDSDDLTDEIHDKVYDELDPVDDMGR